MKIIGKTHYLWRAVDHEGEVLESYVTKKRHKFAALRFFKKTLKRHGSPASIVTDGLKSYPAAMKDLVLRIAAKWVGGSTIGLRTAIYRSDEENV